MNISGLYLNAKVFALRTSVGGSLSVDRQAGVVRGVSVITAGTTRISGNGVEPFDVDAVTLKQVADLINASSAGIKSRITHPELENQDGIEELVGKVRNARIEAGRVVADVHLGAYAEHSPKGNLREFIFGLAEDAPTDAGLSIVCPRDGMCLTPANTPTGRVLRVQALSAVDWVSVPAANPAGMLSTERNGSTLNKEVHMTPAQLKYLQSLGLALSAKSAEVKTFMDTLTPDQVAELDRLASETGAVAGTDNKPLTLASLSAETFLAISDFIEARASRAAAGGSATSGAKATAVADPAALALAAERKRVAEIRDMATMCGLGDTWAAEQIVNGTEVEVARKVALKAKAEGWKPIEQAGTGTGVTVGSDLNRESLHLALRDALLLGANAPLHKTDEHTGAIMLSTRRDDRTGLDVRSPVARDPHPRANEFRGQRMVEMGRRFLLALGYKQAANLAPAQLATLLMSRSAMQRAMPGVYLAHSTNDFDYILADVMGKTLASAYALAQPTWRQWCTTDTNPDFKTKKWVTLGGASALSSMEHGEEYTYGSLSDSQETLSLVKYGKAFAFTREMLINDDLGALQRLPVEVMNRVIALEESVIYGILNDGTTTTMSDTGAIFNATAITTAGGHGNLTSSGTAISVDSLGVGRAMIRKQKRPGTTDQPADLIPNFLLVGVDDEQLAWQYTSPNFTPSGSSGINPFATGQRAGLIPISSQYLTSTPWYLVSTSMPSIVGVFLQGEEAPVIEENDDWNNDARKMKVRHYFGAKCVDFRPLYRNAGT